MVNKEWILSTAAPVLRNNRKHEKSKILLNRMPSTAQAETQSKNRPA
ncbi:Uncharacterized protein dnl_10410 [Desulfonema limicola]|uniref:Uncharacterized protein n=1 Tax=Desulfonema limicola TaxID=45656 RepID=A0A975B4U6_9BACT|nr:Uncharacterized protein dnl_10410 [Desulfonema limicola]